MTFIWPVMLLSLLLIPLFVVIYLRQQRRKKRMVLGTMISGVGGRRHVPPAFFLAGIALLLTGLSRPQAMLALPKIEGTVILAFDVSGSMVADDLKPTRIEAAKVAAKDFIKRQPSTVQIGVVAFTDNGFATQIPTNDQQALFAAIDRLAPQRGTSIGHGIQVALNAIAVATNPLNGEGPNLYSNLTPVPTPSPTPVPQGTYGSSVIVMLTDGENNEAPDPLAIAQMAAQRGVRIYTVGIGSAAGTNVHINGFTLHTQLDEDTLKQIAQTTGGAYFNADSTEQLQSIYDNLDPELMIKPEKTEVTSLFAGASVLVMLVGGMMSLLWFGRVP